MPFKCILNIPLNHLRSLIVSITFRSLDRHVFFSFKIIISVCNGRLRLHFTTNINRAPVCIQKQKKNQRERERNNKVRSKIERHTLTARSKIRMQQQPMMMTTKILPQAKCAFANGLMLLLFLFLFLMCAHSWVCVCRKLTHISSKYDAVVNNFHFQFDKMQPKPFHRNNWLTCISHVSCTKMQTTFNTVIVLTWSLCCVYMYWITIDIVDIAMAITRSDCCIRCCNWVEFR